MSTPVKKTLRDVRAQLESGYSLRGNTLSESQIENLKIKEQALLKQQRDERLQKEKERKLLRSIAEGEGNRVIQQVEATSAASTLEICNNGDKNRDVLMNAMAAGFARLESLFAPRSRTPRQASGKGASPEQKQEAEERKKAKEREREDKKRETEQRKIKKQSEKDAKQKRKAEEKEKKDEERKVKRAKMEDLKRQMDEVRGPKVSSKKKSADSKVKEDDAEEDGKLKEDAVAAEGVPDHKQTGEQAASRVDVAI